MNSNLFVRFSRRIIYPHLKGEFLQHVKTSVPSILDVGCGNNSPSHIKSVIPCCKYTGIDVSDYNQTKPNVADNYILVTPMEFADRIAAMENGFDAIISAHNLEHCNKREETLLAMIKALKKGGRHYLSFPYEKSVKFPSRGGTLNYYDDKTHLGLPPSYKQIVETLQNNGMKIIYSTPSHSPFIPRLIGFIKEPISKYKNKTDYFTWSYYGFQTVIWAEKIK